MYNVINVYERPRNTRHSNNVEYSVHFNATHDRNALYCLPIPRPHFDQLIISIFFVGDILPVFISHFGKPTMDYKKEKWRFSNGLYLSKYNTYFHYLVYFQATDSILMSLHHIADLIPKKNNGKSAIQIRAAEIAWDIPLEQMSETRAEDIFCSIANVAFPICSRARLFEVSGKSKKTNDNAINGCKTSYFQSMKYNDDRKLVRINRPQWHAKLYLKKLDGVWNVRIEIKLARDSLSRRMPKHLPRSIYVDLHQPSIKIDQFWQFANIDVDALAEKAFSLARKKGYRKILGLKICINLAHRSSYGLTQKLLFKKIARFLKSSRFSRAISSYIIPHEEIQSHEATRNDETQ